MTTANEIQVAAWCPMCARSERSCECQPALGECQGCGAQCFGPEDEAADFRSIDGEKFCLDCLPDGGAA